MRSNLNFLLYREIHHAVAAVVAVRLSPPKVVWSRWQLPLPRVGQGNGGPSASSAQLFLLKTTPSTGVGATEYSTLKLHFLVL